jgi:CO dehydrogenase/acetyl-CoA synthase delta subunit
MSTKAETSRLLLLLPVTSTTSNVWSLRQSEMHVENWGLRHQARKCFYDWIGDGGKFV